MLAADGVCKRFGRWMWRDLWGRSRAQKIRRIRKGHQDDSHSRQGIAAGYARERDGEGDMVSSPLPPRLAESSTLGSDAHPYHAQGRRRIGAVPTAMSRQSRPNRSHSSTGIQQSGHAAFPATEARRQPEDQAPRRSIRQSPQKQVIPTLRFAERQRLLSCSLTEESRRPNWSPN